MTENEQINEMANDLAQHCPDLVENCCGASSCVSCLTRFLFNAGYRKLERGEWAGNAYFGHCSECGMVVNWSNVPRRLYNYCPHCGADMRGDGK